MSQFTAPEWKLRWLIDCAKDAVSTGDMTKEQALEFVAERSPINLDPAWLLMEMEA